MLVGVWLGGHPGWIPGSLKNAFVGDRTGELANEVGDLPHAHYRPLNDKNPLNAGLTAAVASLTDGVGVCVGAKVTRTPSVERLRSLGSTWQEQEGVVVPRASVPPFPVPVPVAHPGMPKSHDARRMFAKITSGTERDEQAERAFLAMKAHVIRTHPRLDRHQRGAAFAELVQRVGYEPVATAEARDGAPVPGGVGYGFFYEDPFKGGFAQGTSLYWEIVCPNPPGGNVNTSSI
jgi:hypothetical protein